MTEHGTDDRCKALSAWGTRCTLPAGHLPGAATGRVERFGRDPNDHCCIESDVAWSGDYTGRTVYYDGWHPIVALYVVKRGYPRWLAELRHYAERMRTRWWLWRRGMLDGPGPWWRLPERRR